MKTHYLLPAFLKNWGLLVFIPAAVCGILTVANDWAPSFLDLRVPALFVDGIIGDDAIVGWTQNNILNELCAVLAIFGGIMFAFSKEKDEDELIASIRLRSLVWATYWNYGILLLAILLVYDITFIWVMIVNMFTLLVFFGIRFNWAVWKLRKSVGNEE